VIPYDKWHSVAERLSSIFTANYATLYKTRCHAIAGTTARCALYMNALKIVCKRKISRRLRKNRHIKILSPVLLTRTLEQGPGQRPGLGCQGPGQGQGLESEGQAPRQ